VRIRQYPNLTIGGVSNPIQTRTTDRLSFANAGRFPFPRLLVALEETGPSFLLA
jgi:hypothetical protein